MMLSPAAQPHRRGLSILEVLVSVMVFLVAFGTISELLSLSARHGLEATHRQQAVLICQSKLAEVVVGAIPLSSQSETAVEEDPAWMWSLQCEQNSQATGLWNVIVRVSRTNGEPIQVECVLNQMVLDPSLRGSTLDSTTISGTETQDMGTTGTSTSTTTSGTGQSTTPTTGGSR